MVEEAEAKNGKTFITCLVSLGHICYLIPKKVGKEIKDFISKSIVKDILMHPINSILEISFNESCNSLASKRKVLFYLLIMPHFRFNNLSFRIHNIVC